MNRKLDIHIGGDFDALAKRVSDAWHRAEKDAVEGQEHLTFASSEAITLSLSKRDFDVKLGKLREALAKGEAALNTGNCIELKNIDDIDNYFLKFIKQRSV